MESMQLSYGVTIEQIDGQFVVTIPDLPEARATATRFSDAFDAATACLESALAERIARAEPIPTPSRILGCKATPGTAIASKALLHKILLETGRTVADLAEKLGKDEAAVRRLLDPNHPSDPGELSAHRRGAGRPPCPWRLFHPWWRIALRSSRRHGWQ